MSGRSRAPGLSPRKLLRHLEVLASDEMAGRESATKGSLAARHYLRGYFSEIGLQPLFSGYEQPFVFDGLHGGPTQGFNVVGLVRGRLYPEVYITISAHYDHLGRERSGEANNGADDNASGVAAVLELARVFASAPSHCSLVFCLFDAEEAGLEGSKAFVARAPVPLDRIALAVNVDMIGRSDEGLLWVAGARHSPWLDSHLQAIAAAVDVPLVTGHDRFSLVPGDDWTHLSDHGSFHDVGVPWLHFGVSNHGDTHEPSDEIGAIDDEFMVASANAVLTAVRHFDAIASELLAESR